MKRAPALIGAPSLPSPRGDLSDAVITALGAGPGTVRPPTVLSLDPLADDDLHLALYVCYELHYRGFDGVDEAWEWEPSLLALRRELEHAFEDGLAAAVPIEPVDSALDAIVEVATTASGPSLSHHVLEHGTIAELREFAVHRSLYQLKEADPHSWGIPRLTGPAKAALVHIQCGEYGEGDGAAMHSTLFATTLRSLGLDDAYGRYLDVVPGTTLATVNLVSLFGLHRRWRGALVGHLALFEMTSVGPMGRYAAAMRRLGLDRSAGAFYDVHVEADAAHELVAADMVRATVRAEPDLAAELAFGARTLAHLESRFTAHLLRSWREERTSLLAPIDPWN